MRRVPEVIDCWFDSGAMPFAQWGWPHTGVEHFQSQWPADFISEAIDQTRGWFYSQLAISTLLFGPESTTNAATTNAAAAMPPKEYPHPFRNCIVLGHMLGEDGGKMSKSKRNYKEPSEILDRYGAMHYAGTFSLGNLHGIASAIASRQFAKASQSFCYGSGTSIASLSFTPTSMALILQQMW